MTGLNVGDPVLLCEAHKKEATIAAKTPYYYKIEYTGLFGRKRSKWVFHTEVDKILQPENPLKRDTESC